MLIAPILTYKISERVFFLNNWEKSELITTSFLIFISFSIRDNIYMIYSPKKRKMPREI